MLVISSLVGDDVETGRELGAWDDSIATVGAAAGAIEAPEFGGRAVLSLLGPIEMAPIVGVEVSTCRKLGASVGNIVSPKAVGVCGGFGTIVGVLFLPAFLSRIWGLALGGFMSSPGNFEADFGALFEGLLSSIVVVCDEDDACRVCCAVWPGSCGCF